MKKHLLALCLFTIVSLSAAAQNTASPHVRAHIKEQNARSFESRMKRNKGFTLESAKRALASEKEKRKAAKRRERKAAKRDGIYERINQFKTN